MRFQPLGLQTAPRPPDVAKLPALPALPSHTPPKAARVPQSRQWDRPGYLVGASRVSAHPAPSQSGPLGSSLQESWGN